MGDKVLANGFKPVKHGFLSFEHAAADIVLAASFNAAGTRVVICSADHRIRVYDILQDKQWTLLDQFRGHDAGVLDVQWLSSSLGQHFATIGGDNRFKVWQEDPSQSASKGRRFRCMYNVSPQNHVSYVSFGFKTMGNDVYLALMTHDGLLSLLEPADPESVTDWNQIDQLYPFGQHHRGTEARFRLSFHQAEGPCPNAVLAGLDPKAISLAVSALSYIKILRATKPEDASEGNFQFFEMLQIDIRNALINEVAWAPGCLHPFDVIATACDDGNVRIFYVDTPRDAKGKSTAQTTRTAETTRGSSARTSAPRDAPSGIGAGLAGMSRMVIPGHNVANKINIRHVAREVAILPHEGSPVWKIRWLYDGNALASTADNGKLHFWRESVNGDFIEFAESELA